MRKKPKFKSVPVVRSHYDNPKKVYQIHTTGDHFKWLCSTKTKAQADNVIRVVDAFLQLPQAAQITKHLNKLVKKS